MPTITNKSKNGIKFYDQRILDYKKTVFFTILIKNPTC